MLAKLILQKSQGLGGGKGVREEKGEGKGKKKGEKRRVKKAHQTSQSPFIPKNTHAHGSKS